MVRRNPGLSGYDDRYASPRNPNLHQMGRDIIEGRPTIYGGSGSSIGQTPYAVQHRSASNPMLNQALHTPSRTNTFSQPLDAMMASLGQYNKNTGATSPMFPGAMGAYIERSNRGSRQGGMLGGGGGGGGWRASLGGGGGRHAGYGGGGGGGGGYGVGGMGSMPDIWGDDPTINATPDMFGGGRQIDDIGSVQNPDMTNFLLGGMNFQSQRAQQMLDWLLGNLQQQTALGTTGMQTDAQRFGIEQQRLTAQEQNAVNEMIAKARYGPGGLEGRTLEQQAELARLGMTSQEDIARMQTEASRYQSDAQQRAFAARVAALGGEGAIQDLLGGGLGGRSVGLGGLQGDVGLGEQEFARQELAAGGRRAADEAATIKGAVEAATGPGGGGMAAGPAEQAAMNRAQLARLQVGASERQAERQRMQEMALARRGQNMGFLGSFV